MENRFDMIPEERKALAMILSEGILDAVDFYFAARNSGSYEEMMQNAIESAFANHHSEEGSRKHAAIASARDNALKARREYNARMGR